MNYDNSKLSTELNLALNIPYEEREKSLDLDVGYSEELDEWELIIRYVGSLEEISRDIPFIYNELLGGYAIIRISSELIGKLSNNPYIIFIEKPKNLYNERVGRINGFSQSCMDMVTTDIINLTGRGVMVSVIDSGIDVTHQDFRDGNNSRVYELWDQTIPGNPPAGYNIGTVYTRDDINAFLTERSTGNTDFSIQSYDLTGHGTGVASVVSSCVPDADLLVIKLYGGGREDYTRTTALMTAIDYSVRKSLTLNVPMVINLSFGNNYGDHGGSSVLENYIDAVAGLSRLSIVTGMGNDGSTGRHAQFMLGNTSWYQIDFLVNPYESGINLQVWKSYADIADIFLITPGGRELGPFNLYQEIMNYNLPDMNISVINGYPTPINENQETYISIIPKNEYIEEGIWSLRFNPKSISNGRVDVWLPVAGSTSSEVRFTRPSEYTTLTIPATARKAISVGAYDPATLTYAPFSGRGFTTDNVVKPELSAPGVNIDVAAPGGGYVIVSGTSFAAPFVSAGAAMLMEWGIVMRNDPYLYAEKLKAYLISGARRLPGNMVWPNERLGWGALCVADSLPL